MTLNARRIYLVVAACAVVAHLGALWNRFADDDVYIVAMNPLVQHPETFWRAFLEPYWPGNISGTLYRPLTIASFALDRLVDGVMWHHAVNLFWHAGASVLVAVLALQWAGAAPALLAGVLFAVHPVHVEAVASLVGRNELMAGVFTLLGVYAAVVRGSVAWSAVAMAAGILSKENAAMAPALIVWAWVARMAPLPSRRTLAAYGATWLILGAAYAWLRWSVLHPYASLYAVAPVFTGQGALTVRLTAVAALGDVARLLVFPLHLRADYSPDERTAVTSPFDLGFLAGLLSLGVWAALLALAWRRGRRVEAFGLGWIGLTYLPVANLLFPTGLLIAERTLYLPSVGFALAVGATCRNFAPRQVAVAAAVCFLVGGARSALRVPVWRNNETAALSMLEDAPRSYRSWDFTGWSLLWGGKTERALGAFEQAGKIYTRDARVYLAAGDAAITLGRYALADSLLALAEAQCGRCVMGYRNQAGAARLRGAQAAADSLDARARRVVAR